MKCTKCGHDKPATEYHKHSARSTGLAAWNRRAESGTFDKPFVFQTRPTVPEGWKLVPIEPTVEIVQAAQDYFVSHDEWGFSGMYRAMLAAAPEVKR